jgi:tetratricopeptide (TPR) repeat protein
MLIKSTGILFLCIIIFVASGCTKKPPLEQPAPGEKYAGQKAPAKPVQPAEPTQPAGPGPRAQASAELTEEGSRLLKQKQPDKAIRVLEQAITLDPNNGRNYYYMAEAWLLKEVAPEAKEFNQLAELHLKGDDEWLIRVAQQADRIAELEK